MITIEALAEELGLTHWWIAILMEEARIYSPIGEPVRVLPEGATAGTVSAGEWRAAPLTEEFAELCRARFAGWAT
jgi:hypothetical protein